ncbi:MAG: hypothetical protein GDA65_10315 [Nitrospira sp. CR1.1]|nr:hypothetical protein [Nitrospira sp. CR1.1]
MTNSMKRETTRILTCDDVRCRCGQLMARWAEQGIEIKCKRCRRLVTIAFDAIAGRPPAIVVN